MSNERFKVIIVGGSIAGLTLAHCLRRLGIDYVVLERRDEIAPQEGASIGIMPNGGRILDQLGLYDQIEELVEPLSSAHMRYPSGFSFQSNWPNKLRERITKLMSPYKLKMGLALTVTLLSGQTAYIASTDMTIEYACVYGISSPNASLTPGQQITCLNDGWSILSVIGKKGRTFWFLFLKLGQRYTYGAAPRFSARDASFYCDRLRDEPYWGNVRFGDLWDRREAFNMAPLEEMLFSQWHWGRIVCIGDSMHKIAPHTGQGANCAIEDGASLSNQLYEHFSKNYTHKPSSLEISRIFQRLTRDRMGRLADIDRTSRFAMRLQARDGVVRRLLGRIFLPYARDKLADWASADIANTVTLAMLPASKRKGPGWEQFKPKSRVSLGGIVAGFLFLCGLIIAITA
ncbi:zeaxanthin epoxidase, chloroplastic [Aspergillus udagawae]|uniref:Zeaxanthin epoxidase, chloroplastic n=1 Tax=Aspergillus udagawae TaxID=91492 RepID=A0A8H3SAV7_9EURO|nr:zeaxanthin epoxidase, chloroplastic [Aspergillus udagawae]